MIYYVYHDDWTSLRFRPTANASLFISLKVLVLTGVVIYSIVITLNMEGILDESPPFFMVQD